MQLILKVVIMHLLLCLNYYVKCLLQKVKDLKDRPLLLFVNEWSIRMTQERNDGLVLTEFAR